MGWDNPPVPWQEFEQRLSWRQPGNRQPGNRQPGNRQPGHRQPGHRDRDANGPGSDDDAASEDTRDKARRLRPVTRLPGRRTGPAWAELHCHSSYSFLDGASSPGDLVGEALQRGLTALAITDHDGMYGVPQFAQAAARVQEASGAGLGTIFGAELSLGLPGGQSGIPDPAGRHLLVLARDPDGYRRLCRVISAAQVAGKEKGRPVYDLAELAGAHDGHWVILTGCRKGAVPAALDSGAATGPAAARELGELTGMFGRGNVVIELTSHDQPADDERNDALFELAGAAGVPAIATNNVHYADPPRARLAQALAAIRSRRSLDEMDGWLAASGAAYIRSGQEMAARLRRYPGVLERTVELAADCAFNFKVIAPDLPDFPVPEDYDETRWLRELVARKALKRYGPPDAERVPGAYRQIERELEVIEETRVPWLLPDRARHRGVLRERRHPLSGAGVSRQLSRLLRDRDYQRGPRSPWLAVRTVPVRWPGRAARH